MHSSTNPNHESDPDKTTISLGAPVPQEQLNFSLQQLGFILQSSLNLYEILKKFNNEIKKVITYQSLHYFHSPTKQQFEIGKLHYHQARYQLKIENCNLGELVLSKNVPFSEKELTFLENTLILLLFPIKNALAFEKSLKLSITDSLTQLTNRQGFEKALNREVKFSTRHGTNISLLVIDLDNFKSINDQYGHLAGDSILSQFAEQLRIINRQTDMTFRYGGEEFTMILSHTDANGAMQVANRLREAIEKAEFTYEDKKIPLTVSIGVSTLQKDDNVKTLFSKADSALYEAKFNGRNQVKIAY